MHSILRNRVAAVVASKGRAMPERRENVGCLALTRRYGESVRIGDSVVRVEEGSGRRVRLIIQAPRDVPIVREEDAELEEAAELAAAC